MDNRVFLGAIHLHPSGGLKRGQHFLLVADHHEVGVIARVALRIHHAARDPVDHFDGHFARQRIFRLRRKPPAPREVNSILT